MNSRIDISDSGELRIWACKLNVTPERLLELIRRVGPSPDQIRDALKRAEIGHVCGRDVRAPAKEAS